MNRQSPILLLLLFLPALCATQTFERGFNLELAPALNGRRIAAGSDAGLLEVERIDSIESGNFGYSIGLLYETRTDKLGFSTGFRYNRMGYEGVDGTVNANYIGLPLELLFFQDATPRDRIMFLMGLGAQYHLSNSFEGERVDREPFRSLVISFNTGFGYDRKLNDDWALRIQPNFRFFLQGNRRPGDDLIANRNLYQLGVKLVVRRLII